MFGCLETGPRHELGEFINDVMAPDLVCCQQNSSEKMVLSVLWPEDMT